MIKLPEQISDPDKYAALIVHLGKAHAVDEAFALAQHLLPFEALSTYPWIRSARGFNEVHYWHILPPIVSALEQLDALRALHVLIDQVEQGIDLSGQYGASGKEDDGLTWWRSAIEDHTQNQLQHEIGAFIEELRKVAEHLATTHPEAFSALLSQLENHSKLIFRRIVLHLLRLHPDSDPERTRAYLVSKENFSSEALYHEYWLLMTDRFKQLDNSAQAEVLEWIDAGPEGINSRKYNRYVRRWQFDRLWMIQDVLPVAWAARFRRLKKRFKPPQQPLFIHFASDVFPESRPVLTTAELKDLPPEQVVQYAQTWEPAQSPYGPSMASLGQNLKTLIAEDARNWSARAEWFIGLDPTYVRAYLRGLQEGLEKQPLEWKPVLALCKWVVAQPRDQVFPGGQHDRDPHWGYARHTIAELIYVGTRATDHKYLPYDLRADVWSALLPITDDPDPDAASDEMWAKNSSPAYDYTLNCTRGEAMLAVIRYILWVRMSIDGAYNLTGSESKGFGDTEEAATVLNGHLDPGKERSPAVRAAYGYYLPWLIHIDSAWVREHLPALFPSEEPERQLRDAVWNTYIILRRPTGATWDVLGTEYAAAVEEISLTEKQNYHDSPAGGLSEHLMMLYWWGKILLAGDSSLVARFFAKAPDELRAYTISYIGRSCESTDSALETDIYERFIKLWEWRLELVRTHPVSSYFKELAAFGEWFASGKFDDDWSLMQLRQVLELTHKIEPSHKVVKRLRDLSPTHVLETVECLRLIVSGPERDLGVWGWDDEALEILGYAEASSDNSAIKAAQYVRDTLISKGYEQFRPKRP